MADTLIEEIEKSNLNSNYFDKIESDGFDYIGKKYYPIGNKTFHMGYLKIRESHSYDNKRILGYFGTFYLIGKNFYKNTTSFSKGTWGEMEETIKKIENAFKTIFN